MSLFHSNGKNSCFTEDALMMSLQSLGQDSSLEEKRTKRDDKPSSSHLSTRSGDNPDEEEPSDDLLKQRKVHSHSKWKPRHDADYWINLARAQEKGLQFWQTRSHVIIVYNTVLAFCIDQSDFLKRRMTLT